MTVQQQVANRVANLSEEGARLIDQMLNSMKTTFFVSNTSASKESGTFDVSKRFGAGEGIITNVENFKSDNDEIAKMFEGFE